MKTRFKYIYYQMMDGFWSILILLIFYLSVSDVPRWINLLPTQARIWYYDMKETIDRREQSSSEHTHNLEYFKDILREVKSNPSPYYGGPIGGHLV